MRKAWVNLNRLWDKELTNLEVSKATGLHPNTVSNYRRGVIHRPQLEVLLQLRDFFQERLGRTVTLDEMVQDEQD